MRARFRIVRFTCHIVVMLALAGLSANGQNLLDLLPRDPQKEWQRIVTGPDSTTDLSTQSLVLEPNGIFRAKFRTTFSKSEKSFEKPGVKYKTRLETIQFDSRKYLYRILGSALLDSSEKPVFTADVPGDWRPVRGRTAGVLYSAASRLGPLGWWTVVGVRYFDGVTASPEDDPDLAQLKGRGVTTQLEKFEVGKVTCSPPSYEMRSIRNDEFAKATGRSLRAAGFSGDQLESLLIKCQPIGGSSELHILVFGPNDQATLLSGGVLLDLEKLKQ